MSATSIYLFIVVSLFSYILTCWALVDAAYRKFNTLPQKAAWVLIAFIPFAGWIVYFVFGKKRGTRSI